MPYGTVNLRHGVPEGNDKNDKWTDLVISLFHLKKKVVKRVEADDPLFETTL